MVNRMDDVGVRSKESVCLYFLQGKGDRFLTKRATDLLQGIKFASGAILNKVYIGETALERISISVKVRIQLYDWKLTSPSSRSIFKLRLLIFN